MYHRKVVAYTAISTQGRHMSGVRIAMRPWSRRQQVRGSSGPRQNQGMQHPPFLARFSLSFAPCLFSACTMVKAYPSQALMCNTMHPTVPADRSPKTTPGTPTNPLDRCIVRTFLLLIRWMSISPNACLLHSIYATILVFKKGCCMPTGQRDRAPDRS